MTTTTNLTPTQQQDILTDDIAKIASIGAAYTPGSIDTSKFVFFAAFDGTGNTLDDDHPKTADHPDNVSALWKQYAVLKKSNTNLQGNYYPGPGTDFSRDGSSFDPPQVTGDGRDKADEAYKDFVSQAQFWLSTKPPGTKIDPQIVVASFSRGDVAMSYFSQMLYEKGLVDGNGNVLIPPGVIGISAGVMFDSVTTGASGNLAQAPTSKNIVDIIAGAEYRRPFKSTDYSSEHFVSEFTVIGNHSDIGGGYGDAVDANGNIIHDPSNGGATIASNGISSLTFGAADSFLAGSGITGLDGVAPDPNSGVLTSISANNIYVTTKMRTRGYCIGHTMPTLIRIILPPEE